jgi:hypothetical protein
LSPCVSIRHPGRRELDSLKALCSTIFPKLRWVMKWIRERDTLIAQTLAFVQTIAGKKDDATRRQARPAGDGEETDVTALEAVRTVLAITEPPRKTTGDSTYAEKRHPIAPSEVKREIQSRIDSFRAHQERFNRERAEYFSATLAKLRAALEEMSRGPRK